MGLKIFFRWITKRDQNPEWIEGHSLTKKFLDLCYTQWNINNYSIDDITSTSRSVDYNHTGSNMALKATSGIVNNGLIVGTDTTTPTIDDDAIGVIIAHGVGGGELQYGASSVSAPVISGTSSDCILARPFTNGSGADITVEEIAVYAVSYIPGPTVVYFCVAHDLDTHTIVDTDTETLQYTIRVTI